MKTGALLLSLALAPSLAFGSITINVESKSITSQPSSAVDSFFDVFFTVESPDTNTMLAGYQIKLSLNPTPGLAFQSPFVANTSNPEHTPVFPSNPPLDFSSDSTTIQAAADTGLGADQQIDNGDGLIRVLFSISPGTVGSFNINIDTVNTFLSDTNASPISYAAVNGVITVVPEPATVALVGLGFAGMLVLHRRRRLTS